MTLIEKKYQELGGTNSFLGSLINSEINTPGGQGSYAVYEHGMIFYNPTYGAVAISEKITTKWNSNSVAEATTSDNIKIRTYLGFPIKDSFQLSINVEVCYFERGMIVVNSRNPSGFVVYGSIYIQYRNLDDVHGWLGLPISDEQNSSSGGRVSLFENADIYWASNLGAHEVHGAIKDRYNDLGGASGFLGFPISNELPISNGGSTIGKYNLFQGGSIYWSSATGAWEIHGSLRKSWLTIFDGPTGELGFPTSNETTSIGDNYRFNNFKNGVLAWQKLSGQVRKITKLDFVVNSFEGRGSDGWMGTAGGVDVYVELDITGSNGFSFQSRYPNDGDMGTDHNFDENSNLFCTIPIRDGNLSVLIGLSGYDSDTDKDDFLGGIGERYTIDTLWDTTTIGQDWHGDFKASFNLRADGFLTNPFDSANFRRDLFWNFKNKVIGDSIDTLTQEIFASTFSDVGQDEFWLRHPFNFAFYQVYSRVISPKKGVCFGMALEAIGALKGSSSSNEPISQYPIDAVRKNQIAIKHGYQLGAEVIDFALLKIVSGNTRNPVLAFNESRDAFNRGDYAVLSMSKSMGEGHAVVPYDWNTSDPNAWIMKVANPNTPFSENNSDGNIGDRIIVINPVTNSFTYQHGEKDQWTGNSSSGSRMYAIPYSKMSSMPRTPFWEVLAALAVGTIIVMADGGEITQITDGNGKTFYKDRNAVSIKTVSDSIKKINLPIATKKIIDSREIINPRYLYSKSINEDSKTRIPNMAEFIPISGKNISRQVSKVNVEAAKSFEGFEMPHKVVDSCENTIYYLKLDSNYDKMFVPQKDTKYFPDPVKNIGSLSASHYSTMIASKNFSENINPSNFRDHLPNHQKYNGGHFTSSMLQSLITRSLTIEISNKDNSEYSWGINSGMLAMHIVAPSIKDTVDVIAIDGIGLPGQAITFKLNEIATAKKIKMNVGGFNDSGRRRMFELTNIAIIPGQTVTLQISDGGKELIMHNSGPELNFDLNLRVSTDANPLIIKSGLKIDSNAVATIATDDWENIERPTSSSVIVNIFDKLGGTIIRHDIF